jgi:hypothetical protein
MINTQNPDLLWGRGDGNFSVVTTMVVELLPDRRPAKQRLGSLECRPGAGAEAGDRRSVWRHEK